MIKIDVQSQSVIDTLNRLQTAVGPGLTREMQKIGDDMVERIKQRFATSTDPEGVAWAPNSPLTMQRYLNAKFKTNKKGNNAGFNKDGSLSAKGTAAQANKKPLIGRSQALSTQTAAQMQSATTLLISNPVKYAAIQQFGAQAGASGKDKRNHPIPWGNIPPRRFFPLTNSPTPEVTPAEVRLIQAQVQTMIEASA